MLNTPAARIAAFALLVCALPANKLWSQISPSAPTKEYIRLADRIIAIEQIPFGILNSYTLVAGGGGGIAGQSDSLQFASGYNYRHV